MKLLPDLILAGIVLVSGVCPANAEPSVAFTACPKPMQLYPRNLSTGFAEVTIAGTVLSSNCTQVSVAVTRAGTAYTNLTQALTYQAGQAPFAFTVPIYAELAGYDFTVQVTSDATAFTVATATNVVAGDVLLINGQSNAVAAMYNGSANGNQSNWLRSFGYRTESATTTTNDLNWYLAEGNADEGPGAVGQWGLRLGRWLSDSNAVPVAIINGARGGEPISYYQRTDMNHANVANNYGRLLWRVAHAELTNAVRAILWYQGETDADDGASHETGWLKVYSNWREDFATVEKVYVCQLHAGCGPTTRELPDLRDRQRRFADRDSDIEVMSTTAVPQHTDGCHYAYDNGYRVIGESLYRLVERDLYGVAAANSNPPNPAYAYFSGANTNEVRIELRDTADTLTWDSGAHADFRLEGSAATPTNGFATAHTIVLQFNQNVGAATGVSYLGHYGSGANAKNANGVGLLAFYNVSVLAADPGGSPGVPTQLQTILVGAHRVDLAWTPVVGAASYLIRRDGQIIGSTSSSHYVDRAVQPGQTYFYQVAASGAVATSAWTAAVSATPVADNVFALVPEANDYFLLYQLDIAVDFQTVNTLDVPYTIDNSAIYTAGIQRVAYYVELQDNPGNPMRWVYVSMNAFTNNPTFLGVPVLVKGVTFQTYVQDMNVFASTNTGLVTGPHITTGNIEFWGYNSNPTNAAGILGASDSAYDFGDQFNTSGPLGSMQVHNYGAGQTLFAYNRWGKSSGTDDIGIGNCTYTNTDWTFAANTPTWNVKRLYVLVLTDADNDTLPDAWELAKFGTLNYGPNDDPDGDGFTNSEEWQAGTHPLQASSAFTAQQVTQEPTGFRITWASVPGKSYDIEYKNEMMPGSWNSLTSNIPASASPTTDYLDTTAVGLPKRFYQIKLRSP
ncbi:MAG TPA: sialate O-acetylesterase [Verrucomicrobiae bacterium]|nr:sialate O-acetylesterase [Verrucomicrobiae bacterium]